MCGTQRPPSPRLQPRGRPLKDCGGHQTGGSRTKQHGRKPIRTSYREGRTKAQSMSQPSPVDSVSFMRRHWFAGIWAILLLVWAGLGLAWLVGAEGVTVTSESGQSATLDFMRDQVDLPVLGLADGVGLEIEARAEAPGQLRASLLVLEPEPRVLCLCGDFWSPTSLGQVTHRQGDWYFQEPVDFSRFGSIESGSETWQTAIRTLAYNPSTDARLLADVDEPADQQLAKLTTAGLVPGPDTALTLDRLGDLTTVRLRSERCFIYFGAFLASNLLWLLVGGPLAWVDRRRRAR